MSKVSKRILYVEDNYLNYLLIKKIFKKEDVIVERANDAQRALEKLRAMKPDLILMDIQLPGMDGLDLAAAIRENRDLSSIPMVGISASSIPHDREEDARKAGFVAFLLKPLDIEKLGETVSKILWPERGA